MAKFPTIFLLFAVLILAVGIQAQECAENQEYTTCGSACPPSCNDDPSKPCTLQCVVGCQCKQGYLRNAQGACVTQDKC